MEEPFSLSETGEAAAGNRRLATPPAIRRRLSALAALETGGVFFFFLLLAGTAVSRVHSFDIFWQLQSGRYMLEHLAFIRQDLFTLAAEAPRFEHCWLHDLIVFGIQSISGYAGLSLFKGVLVLATAVALYAAARLRGASKIATLLLLPAGVFLAGGWLARPQLWTFLFFALFVLLLERHRQRGDRLVFLLPLLMAVWTNLHAGAILGFALLAAYLVGEVGDVLLRRSPLNWSGYRRLWIAAALVAAAALLTPYPAEFWRTLLHSPNLGVQIDAAGQASGPMTAIFNTDWQPTSFAANRWFFYAAGAAAALLLAGWRRISFCDFCLLAGLFLMGMKLGRHTTFFFLGAAAVLPLYLDTAVRPVAERLPERTRQWGASATLLAALGITFYFWLPTYQQNGLFTFGLRSWHYPLAATDFIREERLPGNLYNTYDWGGYLAWELFPSYRVFWDGRQNSGEMFRLGWEVMAGRPGWEATLDRFEVNTIVVRPCTMDTGERYPLLDGLRQRPEWELVHADAASLLFVRAGSVGDEWLEAHRLPKSRIDDSILANASLLTAAERGRYLAWWEIGRIHWQRKEYPQAFAALEKHLSYAPAGRHLPMAERYFRILYPMMQPGGGGG